MECEHDFAVMEALAAFPGTQESNDNDYSTNNGLESGAKEAKPSSQKGIGEDLIVQESDDFDFDKYLTDLASDQQPLASPSAPATSERLEDCGIFLKEIIRYVESIEIPFQYIDLWVPSYTVDAAGLDVVRLCYAGHVTLQSLLQQEQDKRIFARFSKFGRLSKTLSFAPGEDLPGRIFDKNTPHWIRKYDQTDPSTYIRANAAKSCGVKTALGFAVQAVDVDSVLLCMYSTFDVEEDLFLVMKCQQEMAKLRPVPKWKLVVEVGAGAGVVGAQKPHEQQRESEKTNSPPVKGSDGIDSTQGAETSFSQLSLAAQETVGTLDSCIATFLGENMPLSPTKSAIPNEWMNHFVSLRLLLLTPVAQRTAEEKYHTYLIRKHYIQYDNIKKASDPKHDSSSTKRSTSSHDLAFLLVQEWQRLKKSIHSAPTTAGGNTDGLANHVAR